MDADKEPNLEGLKKLEGAMRRLERERVFVPGQVDEAVLGAVSEHFARQRDQEPEDVIAKDVDFTFESRRKGRNRPRQKVRPWQKWLPLAASIVIAAMMLEFARQGRVAPGDVNRDGVVDVLDAYALAARVASGGPTSRSWDLNDDGQVDAGDSNEIMARAVDLERSGS
jgi:hypothetical protein